MKNEGGEDIKYDVLTRAEVSGILAAIGATTESTTSGNPLTLTSVESLQTVKEKGTTAQESTTGKNLINDSIRYKNGNQYYIGNEKAHTISLAAGTYTFSVEFLNGSHYGAFYMIEGGTGVPFWGSTDAASSATVTLAAGNYMIWIYKSGGVTETDIGHVQLESGSSATTYEPYTGGAPAPSPSYPQGIYGLEGYSDAECTTLETNPYADRYYKVDVTVDGVTRTVRTAEKIAPLYDGDYLDFVSGVVHREKAKTTIPANDTWSWHNTSVFAYHDITGAILTDLSTQGTKEVDCDIAKGVAWTQRAQSYWTASLRYGLSSVALKSPSVTTYAQFQAATANLPITLVYQLATPTDTTTELTADLSALYGSINLNGNGTMEVTYRHG